MNNLVFNTVSSQLRTYITNTSLTVDGNFEITNASVTVTGTVGIDGTADVAITNTSVTVAGNVTISNASVTVNGSVSIDGTADVAIANTSVTVAGNVTISNTSVTVNGSVSIDGTADVAITNTSVTVAGNITVAGHIIAEDTDSLSGATGTGLMFEDTDISQITTGSIFVYNTGAEPLTVSLQISPTTNANFYANDVENDDLPVPAGENIIIAISKYGKYARLLYDAGTGTDFTAYYIGQM